MKLELVATAAFGLEAVVKREIESLGYKILKTEDGRVTYMGDERAIAKSNLWLRAADRVYLKMEEFSAKTFEELYQQVKAINWEKIIPIDGAFPVIGTSVKSELHSVPACQSIVKKAIATRLGEFYMSDEIRGGEFIGTLPEKGATYSVRFSALKDNFLLMVDTSGAGLHKRGYRVKDVEAPIKETIAASMIELSFYKADKILVDTCCGSGTIPIEAAMIARNIAPGLNRGFNSEKWDIIGRAIWKEERSNAYKAIKYDTEVKIMGMDKDRFAIRAAKANAEEAGVIDDIRFVCGDMKAWKPTGEYGVIITNPPYGERIGSKEEIHAIYKKLSAVLKENPTWSLFMITTDKNIENKFFGKMANRRRKLYNGRYETQYYQFHGETPKKG